MPVALLLDEHIYLALASALRTYGIDARHVIEAGMRGLPDEDLLTQAALQGRALLTADVRDFRVLAEEWAKNGRHHAGIIFLPAPLTLGELLRRIISRVKEWEPSLADRVIFLSSRTPPGRLLGK